MNVPLRAISWAIRFFWLITFAFAVTCAYSATLIRIDFGQPLVQDSQEDLRITLPLAFENNGYYTIDDLNITSIIMHNTTRISKGTSHVMSISPQTHSAILHNVSLNVNELVADEYYLFNDADLVLRGSISLNYAHLIPFKLEGNSSIPWGAPLFNFTIGMIKYTRYNLTHSRANIPIAFQNHSPYFSVVGDIQIQILTDRNQTAGEGTVAVDVPAGRPYTGQIEALMQITPAAPSGQIHVYFKTATFSHGPLVVNYG